MNWRGYHEATKHSVESLRRSRHFLDWANMPDPFRHYEGAPVVDLPAGPPSPDIPALEVLLGARGPATAADGAEFLSQLLFYSAAISASKRAPGGGYRYALRVNPSSGNLHPTEFHFLTRGLRGWTDGLYHYRPSSHMAEQRAAGALDPLPGAGAAPVVFVLSSIAWREAWKYRARAYRYCLLDTGHAWQSLALAARAIGCRACALGHFPDDEAARGLGLAADEWPMLLVALCDGPPRVDPAGGAEPVWHGGTPNRLSPEEIRYLPLEEVHAASKPLKGAAVPVADPPEEGAGALRLPAPAASASGFGEVVRRRRSALDYEGGPRGMTLPELSAILEAATQPLEADFAARFVQLYVYAHRVEGVAPGVYRHWPARAELELVRAGGQQVAAAGLSLGQDLAGNACLAFSMIGDVGRATAAHGDRGYRYVHFEAGAIGQRLYLAAEALGLRGTGIGAFFDDQVHRYLGLDESGPKQVVYHFAIGHPVPDPRLDG